MTVIEGLECESDLHKRERTIFVLQLVEGRLSSSPYSLTCAVLYGVVAITAAVLRRRAFSTIILPSEDRGRRASRHPAG